MWTRADGKIPLRCVCVLCAGVLGGSLSGCHAGGGPVRAPLLSRSAEEEEETLLGGLHQDGVRCCQTAAGLGDGAGASLHCRGEGARAGEGGATGGAVLRMTEVWRRRRRMARKRCSESLLPKKQDASRKKPLCDWKRNVCSASSVDPILISVQLKQQPHASLMCVRLQVFPLINGRWQNVPASHRGSFQSRSFQKWRSLQVVSNFTQSIYKILKHAVCESKSKNKKLNKERINEKNQSRLQVCRSSK